MAFLKLTFWDLYLGNISGILQIFVDDTSTWIDERNVISKNQ